MPPSWRTFAAPRRCSTEPARKGRPRCWRRVRGLRVPRWPGGPRARSAAPAGAPERAARCSRSPPGCSPTRGSSSGWRSFPRTSGDRRDARRAGLVRGHGESPARGRRQRAVARETQRARPADRATGERPRAPGRGAGHRRGRPRAVSAASRPPGAEEACAGRARRGRRPEAYVACSASSSAVARRPREGPWRCAKLSWRASSPPSAARCRRPNRAGRARARRAAAGASARRPFAAPLACGSRGGGRRERRGGLARAELAEDREVGDDDGAAADFAAREAPSRRR